MATTLLPHRTCPLARIQIPVHMPLFELEDAKLDSGPLFQEVLLALHFDHPVLGLYFLGP